jgi:hypothetical protein
MILEVLQHGGSRQLWIADLRRLNFDGLLQREIPRGATNKDVEFSRTNIPIVKIGVVKGEVAFA